MGWPREPRTPYSQPRPVPGDLPADVRALMERASALAARAAQVEVPGAKDAPGGGEDQFVALGRRTDDPAYHALLARYRAGEVGREEMLRDPAYRKAAGAVGRALVADLLAHRRDLRLSDEWAAYRADPDGYGLDEEEPEGRGGAAPSGPGGGRGR